MASQGSTSTTNAPNVALIKGDLACNSELCFMRRISNQVPPSLLPAPSKNTAVRNSLRITLLQVRSSLVIIAQFVDELEDVVFAQIVQISTRQNHARVVNRLMQ